MVNLKQLSGCLIGKMLMLGGMMLEFALYPCVEAGFEHDAGLAKKGDKEAFGRLIKACEPSMYRVAKSILKSDEDCADAIQEAVIKAYKGITKLRDDSFFKTWLIKIVMNESYRFLKKKKMTVPMEMAVCGDDTYMQEHEGIEVRNALDTLEEELRLAAVLHYFEDMPVKNIAQLLKIPEGTVKSRLSRARSKLYEKLNIKEEVE